MRENWAEIAGEFALTTGQDLRDLPLHVLYTIGYASMRRSVLRTEDEVKQLNKLDQVLRSTTDTVSDIPDWMGAFEVKSSG